MAKNVQSPGIDCWSVIMIYVVNDGCLFLQCDVGLHSRHSGDKKLGQKADGTLMPATPKEKWLITRFLPRLSIISNFSKENVKPSYLYHSVLQHLF